MKGNGSTPSETPRAKHLEALAQVYVIPPDASPEEAMRICTAALNATHGRLSVIEGHMIEFARELTALARKNRSHWVWPLVTGSAIAVALLERFFP